MATIQTNPTIWQRIKAQLLAPIEPLAAYGGTPPATARKSLYQLHPELAERQHIARWSSDSPALTTYAGPYTYLQGLQNYTSYVWVSKAVRYISDSIKSLVVQVKRDDEVVANHPIEELFKTANSTMSGADLWAWWCVDMMLAGESGLELVRSSKRQYVEVWPRQPHTISIKPAANGKRYYVVESYKIDDGNGDPYTLPPDELLFFKFYNPVNPWRGLSPISAVRDGIRIDQLAQGWSSEFYARGARPDYAVTTPQGTTRSEREALETEILARYAGTSTRPIILEEGVTGIEMLSFPPKDMIWLDHRNMSRDEVAAIFGLPDIIMGFGADSYDTEEKRRVAERAAWTMTLLPLIQFRDSCITEYMQRYGVLKPNEVAATDTSGVPALKADITTKLDQASKLFAMGVPFNRIDEHLELGVGEIEGGEIGYLASGLTPVSFLSQPPEPEPEPAQLNAPDEVVRIIRPKAIEADEQPVGLPLTVAKGYTVEFGSDQHKALYAEFVKRVDPHERRFGAKSAALMRQQEREVLARLRREGKQVKDVGDVADNPFDRDEWEDEFEREMKPEYRRTVGSAGQNALRDVGVSIRFDLLNPHVVQFIRGRAQRFAKRVNQTTWESLKDTLTAGIELGESIDKLAQRVESVMDLRVNQSSTTIARTETISAFNAGSTEGYRQSEVVSQRQWLSTLDDRTRSEDNGDEFDHVSCNGETVGLDDPFVETGEELDFPGDGSGSAGNVINCRCTVVAVVEGE